MKDDVFVDTNILIYAHDVDSGRKYELASFLVRQLWESRKGILSTQVLQEFYVNVTRKIRRPIPRSLAREIVSRYSVWRVQAIRTEEIIAASELEEKHRLSFWDALIVAAASSAGAARIVTEDLVSGRSFLGVRVENPFAKHSKLPS